MTKHRDFIRSMVLTALACLALLLTTASAAWAYSKQDLTRIVMTKAGPDGPSHHLDLQEVNAIIERLARHAGIYPPSFKDALEKQWATDDARQLSGMLNVLEPSPRSSPALLMAIGRANAVAYNLDVPQSGDRASNAFKWLLAQQPDHPWANYHYSVFLAGSGRNKEALPYALKAESLNVQAASYTVGMIHLGLNNRAEAVKWLKKYVNNKPNDNAAGEFLKILENKETKIRTANNQSVE